jgi:DNA-binding NtrC family response regulator
VARRLAAELKERPKLAAMGAFLGITGAERGFAALRRGDQIEILAARNLRPEALSGSSLGTTRGCLEEALRTGRAVREGTRDLNPLSTLAIPLRAEGDVLGAVYIEKTSTAGAFSEGEERDALDFASRVAGPLKRAILLDQVRQTLPSSPRRSIVGHSPALCRAMGTLEKVAPTDARGLLLGESGTGKELFARALQGGEIQPVGAPRSRRVDTRIVCATNRNLEDLVASGKFREDLYYRLNVVVIRIPALRERREDLPILIRNFLVRFASQQKRNLTGFDRPALALLLHYAYPGNVRKLENVTRHAVLMSGGPVIATRDLPEYLRPRNPAESLLDVPRTAAELRQMKRRVREEVEKSFVIEALKRSGGSITRAAAQTGVHRTRLAQLISRHRIDPNSYKNITQQT